MQSVIALLLGFVVLGLVSQRLGKRTYAAMTLVIVAYIAYAFIKG